jgi:AraC family transcriptional activator of pobA
MNKLQIPVFDIDAFGQKMAIDGFYCNSLKEHLQKHHFIFIPHKHDFYLTVLFTKGKGTHEVDFIIYDIKPGSVFFLSPGQMHNWNLSEDTDGFIFFHSKDFYDLVFNNRNIRDLPFFNSIYNSPVLYLDKHGLGNTALQFKEVLREYRTGSELYKRERICSLIDLAYIDLARIYLPKKTQDVKNLGYIDKLRKLEDLVNVHFKIIKSSSVYAEKLNMTRKHLNRICRTCLNKTTSDIITDRIILEAKRMLMQPQFSVSRMAEELDFDDLSYFSRLFKKKTGATPLQFVSRNSDIS